MRRSSMNKYSDLVATLNKSDCEVVFDTEMKNYVTFRTGGMVSVVFLPHTIEALSCILTNLHSEKPVIIGNGSNLLVADKGLSRPVIRLADNFSGITLENEVTIRALAGTKLANVCKFALENSLSGLEFAYGIPGTVGGSVFMNAGAYGGEIADVLESVRVMSPDGNIREMKASELNLGYRTSIFKSCDDIVISADFTLKKGDKSEINATMDDIMNRRISKQPLEYPSAGSTFKRPEGHFAGKLIEDAGLRGYRYGGAMVSEKHCGFIINCDNATTDDILYVISHVRQVVFEQTGITLETEVLYLE